MTDISGRMCQTCWTTPAKHKVMGADGKRRWKCNTCFEKKSPQRASTKRELLERKIFRNYNQGDRKDDL